MRKITFSLISDTVFAFLAAGIMTLTVASYYLPRNYAFALSVCGGLFAAVISFGALRSKSEKRRAKTEQAEKRELILTQLDISPKTKNLLVFEKAASANGTKIKKLRGFLRDEDNKKIIFPAFGGNGLTKTDVVKAYNLLGEDETAELFSSSASAEIKAFADRFGGRITLFIGDEAVKYLEDRNAVPEIKIVLFEKKRKERKRISNILLKKRAPAFLAFGLVFLAMSFIVPLKTYYIVCGGGFTLLFFVCLLFGKTAEKKIEV